MYRHIQNQGKGFTYADNFLISQLITLTEIEPGMTQIKVEGRIKITKSFMFSGMATKESEKGMKANYKDFIEPYLEDKLL